MRPDDVIRLLRQLGGDPDEVADQLDQRNIRGDQACTSCPLAVYLMRHGVEQPWVSATMVFWGSPEQCAELPEGAYAFVSCFDGGRYPELMAEG